MNFSGTTLILLLMKGKSVWSVNVGDSRAVLARQVEDMEDRKLHRKHWMAIAMSRDHKPDEPDEAERIQKSGGRI